MIKDAPWLRRQGSGCLGLAHDCSRKRITVMHASPRALHHCLRRWRGDAAPRHLRACSMSLFSSVPVPSVQYLTYGTVLYGRCTAGCRWTYGLSTVTGIPCPLPYRSTPPCRRLTGARSRTTVYGCLQCGPAPRRSTARDIHRPGPGHAWSWSAPVPHCRVVAGPPHVRRAAASGISYI